MATMRFERTMRARPEDVFAALSNFANAPSVCSGIVRVEMLTDGPVGVGTRFRETRRFGKHEATETMEVLAFEPGRFYTLGCRSCGVDHSSRIEVQPAQEGESRVTMEMRSTPRALPAKLLSPIMGLIMGPMMRQCVEQDLRDVAASVEGPQGKGARLPDGA